MLWRESSTKFFFYILYFIALFYYACYKGRVQDMLHLKEALLTVLQSSLHVVKSSAPRMCNVCILMRIVYIALHYHSMRQ